MRAIDIINFINEDKFSKYTVKQIYDELGKDDFIEYIEAIATKVVRSLNTVTKFNKAKPEISYAADDLHVYYKQKTVINNLELIESLIIYAFDSRDSLYIEYCFKDEKGSIDQSFNPWYIRDKDINIEHVLKEKIISAYNTPIADRKRKFRLNIK